MTVIRFSNVTKQFPLTPLIGPFSFDIEKPGRWAFTGASGSGKSTVLSLMGCMDSPTSGSVELFGEKTSGLNDRALSDLRLHRIGFVHQFFDLLSELSVLDNVLIPLWMARKSDAENLGRQALSRVGIEALAKKVAGTLSGGQKQRVAVARALAVQPDLILADEPTGSLDAGNAEQVIALLKEIQAELQCTLIVATHNLLIADGFENQLGIRHGELSLTCGRDLCSK